MRGLESPSTPDPANNPLRFLEISTLSVVPSLLLLLLLLLLLVDDEEFIVVVVVVVMLALGVELLLDCCCWIPNDARPRTNGCRRERVSEAAAVTTKAEAWCRVCRRAKTVLVLEAAWIAATVAMMTRIKRRKTEGFLCWC